MANFQGGSAIPVYIIDSSQLIENGGNFKILGRVVTPVGLADGTLTPGQEAWLVAAVAQVPNGDEIATRDIGGTVGNLTVLDANGNAVDAGNAPGDYYATSAFSASPVAAEPLKADGSGGIAFGGKVGINGTPTAQFQVSPATAATIGQIIKLAASQTANAIEVQTSTGSIAASINASGYLGIGMTPTSPLSISATSAGQLVAMELRNLQTPATDVGTSITFTGYGGLGTGRFLAAWGDATGNNSYFGFLTRVSGSLIENARFDANTTAGNTRFLIYDVDNGTLARVSVGATDSGGAGFKVLRIPN